MSRLLKPQTRESHFRVGIDTSLGNVLVAGTATSGVSKLMTEFAYDCAEKKYGLIVIRDSSLGVRTYPTLTNYNSNICAVDCTSSLIGGMGSSDDGIDVFAGLNDAGVNQFIINLFDMYNPIDNRLKMSYLNYISLLRYLTSLAGVKLKLNTLANYNIAKANLLNTRYEKNPMLKTRNATFLSSIAGDIRELESYFATFAMNTAGAVLSGDESIEEILSRKDIIEFSLDFNSNYQESIVILSAIVDAINRTNLSATGKTNIAIIVDRAPNNALVEAGVDRLLKNAGGYNVLYTVEDISSLAMQSNAWIDYADSCFFFRQISNSNKEFASEFFGDYEKEVTSSTRGKTAPKLFDRIFRHGMKQNIRTTQTSVQVDRVVHPEEFASLKDDEAIFILKRKGRHGRWRAR